MKRFALTAAIAILIGAGALRRRPDRGPASGSRGSPNGKRLLVSGGAGNPAADIYTFQRWDDGSWTQTRPMQLQMEPDKEGC
jgi:hypothetical protein